MLDEHAFELSKLDVLCFTESARSPELLQVFVDFAFFGPVALTTLNVKPSFAKTKRCSRCVKWRMSDNSGYLVLAEPNLKLSVIGGTSP